MNESLLFILLLIYSELSLAINFHKLYSSSHMLIFTSTQQSFESVRKDSMPSAHITVSS